MPWTNVLTNEDIAVARKLRRKAYQKNWYLSNPAYQVGRRNRETISSNDPEYKEKRAAREKENRKRYYQNDPEKFKAARKKNYELNRANGVPRSSHLKKMYDLTVIQWNEIFLIQDKCCAICKTSEPGGRGHWHTDHCHKTNKVRGILCNSCNLALGHFKDSSEFLKIAIDYLERTK